MANVINDHSDSRDTLLDEIKKLESVSSGVTKPRLPQTKLEETTYTPKSDAEIESIAKTELDEYKRQGEQAVRDKNAADEKTYNAQRDEYVGAMDTELSSLSDKYAAAVRNADNDAIKRGLARSSVAAVTRGEIEAEYLKQNAEIARSYGKKISELDAEIASLDGKLRTALDDFNLSYATKLNTRINELKAEREQKIESVIKYNNEVRAKQAALDESRAKAESDLYASEIKNQQSASSLGNVSDEQRDAIYRSVYDAMDKFLGSMDEHEARIEIRNHTVYREHLSDYYYARLYNKYGRNDGPS